MRIRVLASTALILSLVSVSPALDKAHYRELQKKAATLARQKDWAGYKQALMEIGRELPGDTPRQMLVMASVEMRLGNKAEALKWMEKYAATGLTYDVAADEDLAALDKDLAFDAIKQQMQKNSVPIEKTDLVCALSTADIMPEDLTYQSSSKTFFASSVRHHTLFRVKPSDKTCSASEVPLGADGKHWPTLGVSWDERRKVLWLSASAMPGFSGLAKEEEGKAALLAVDL